MSSKKLLLMTGWGFFKLWNKSLGFLYYTKFKTKHFINLQICKGPTPLSELIVDGLILEILASVPEDVKSVEFTSDGFWRLKQGASLPSANTSSISLNYNQGNNEVIDLTFDTPEKVIIKKNTLVSNANPPVIDLTLSPWDLVRSVKYLLVLCKWPVQWATVISGSFSKTPSLWTGLLALHG